MISKTKTKPNTEKIILGIDPGTNVMGYGVIRVMGNKAELVVMGVIDMRKEKDPYLSRCSSWEEPRALPSLPPSTTTCPSTNMLR